MTRRTDLFHFYENGIGITIIVQLFDVLYMSGGLPLHPELLSAPAPVPGALFFHGPFEGFFVHVGKHQDFAVNMILNYHRDKPVAVEFKFCHPVLL